MAGSLSSELAEKLRRARLARSREPFLQLVALINTFLEERGLGRVVVVGGYAVELYTGGGYRTGDVDIVVEGSADVVERALDALGRRVGRVWDLSEIGLMAKAVDVVSTSYSREKDPVRVRVGTAHVYVEPPEESAISCLNACVYRDSDLDCEKAAMVLAAQWDKIDWEYLYRRAREESVVEMLERLVEAVERARRELGA